MKKKIIYLVTSGHYGGAQKYNLDLARFFNNDNFSSTILCGKEGNTFIFEKKLAESNIAFKKLDHLQRKINLVKDWLAFWEIYNYLKKEKPNILHISSSKAGIIGRMAGWLAGIDKIYYTAHGWVFNEDIWWGKKYFYLFLERFFALFCDKIFCVSRYDVDTGIKYGFDEGKLKLIYNGISNSKLKAINSKLQQQNSKTHNNTEQFPVSSSSNRKERSDASISGISSETKNNKVTIGTVANFFPAKNLELFVEIARELVKNKKNNYRFVIVGDGPERGKIERMIEQKSLQRYFTLPGLLEDYEKIARKFDVFLMTSSKEGFPYILLEIGLMKIPIVASHVGGVGELIIDGVTGGLINNLNKKAYVDKIGDIVDKKNTQEMSERLYEKIEGEYNISKMMREYEEEYIAKESQHNKN